MPSKQLSLETIERFLRCDILSQSNLNQIWEKKKVEYLDFSHLIMMQL